MLLEPGPARGIEPVSELTEGHVVAEPRSTGLYRN